MQLGELCGATGGTAQRCNWGNWAELHTVLQLGELLESCTLCADCTIRTAGGAVCACICAPGRVTLRLSCHTARATVHATLREPL